MKECDFFGGVAELGTQLGWCVESFFEDLGQDEFQACESGQKMTKVTWDRDSGLSLFRTILGRYEEFQNGTNGTVLWHF